MTGPIAALASLCAFLLIRWGLSRWQQGSRGSKQAFSAIRTDSLEMRLNHNTGHLDGKVLQGRLAGRLLGGLSRAELHTLLDDYHHHDRRSVPILEAYLDRRFGTAWRQTSKTDGTTRDKQSSGYASGEMSRKEAYDILGLDSKADEKTIQAAYNRLMTKLHPDHGGSHWLAMRINQARDLLLKQK